MTQHMASLPLCFGAVCRSSFSSESAMLILRKPSSAASSSARWLVLFGYASIVLSTGMDHWQRCSATTWTVPMAIPMPAVAPILPLSRQEPSVNTSRWWWHTVSDSKCWQHKTKNRWHWRQWVMSSFMSNDVCSLSQRTIRRSTISSDPSFMME